MKVFKYLMLYAGCLVTLFSCKTSVNQDSALEDSLVNTPVAPIEVSVMKCEKKPFVFEIVCQGKIVAARQQSFNADHSGIVVALNFGNGKRVHKDELIAILDQKDLQLKYERAKALLFGAEREYQSLLLNYPSLSGSADKESRDSIKLKLRISSGLAAAELDYKEIDQQIKQRFIIAPFDGIIADLKLSSQSHYNAGENLFTLYADQDLMMETTIIETQLSEVTEGMEAIVTPLSDPTVHYRAKVKSINPYVNAQGLIAVLLSVADDRQKKNMLYPGMHSSAILRLQKSAGIVIPKTAVVIRKDKPVVFTVEKGVAKWNNVTISNDNGQVVQISEGLNAGDLVILSNQNQLNSQSQVSFAHD